MDGCGICNLGAREVIGAAQEVGSGCQETNTHGNQQLLTSRAKYALRACLVMADRKAAETWSSAGGLAEVADVPRKFLEAILTQLRDHGLVESRRGPAGGHRLAMAADRISAADIIRAIDGPLAMTPCASATAFRACDDCVAVEECRLRHLMRRARDAVATVLEECSLAELSREGQWDLLQTG